MTLHQIRAGARPAAAWCVCLALLAEFGAFEILRFQTFTTTIFTEFARDPSYLRGLACPFRSWRPVFWDERVPSAVRRGPDVERFSSYRWGWTAATIRGCRTESSAMIKLAHLLAQQTRSGKRPLLACPEDRRPDLSISDCHRHRRQTVDPS